MNNLFTLHPQLNTALKEVASLITTKIRTSDPELSTALKKMATNGGKYLRPAFFWLFATSGRHQPRLNHDQLTKVASSIEVLHMATLIHDDIIDDSPERRGQVAIQARFGKDVAVYAGDYLFTVFFDLITDTMADSRFLRVNARVMHRILRGELAQKNNRFKIDQPLLAYLRSINGKTAALFSLAAEEGAYFGGSDRRTVTLAKRIGQNIGIAFQILDDILDYSKGDQLNKPVLEDLATGVYSLPLLLALRNDPSTLTPLLAKKRAMTKNDMVTVRQLVIANHGITEARQLATAFSKKAVAEIDQLPAGPSRRVLHQLAGQLLKRKY